MLVLSSSLSLALALLLIIVIIIKKHVASFAYPVHPCVFNNRVRLDLKTFSVLKVTSHSCRIANDLTCSLFTLDSVYLNLLRANLMQTQYSFHLNLSECKRIVLF